MAPNKNAKGVDHSVQVPGPSEILMKETGRKTTHERSKEYFVDDLLHQEDGLEVKMERADLPACAGTKRGRTSSLRI